MRDDSTASQIPGERSLRAALYPKYVDVISHYLKRHYIKIMFMYKEFWYLGHPSDWPFNTNFASESPRNSKTVCNEGRELIQQRNSKTIKIHGKYGRGSTEFRDVWGTM